MIDLHIHTNCSDGQYSPYETVQRARNRGVFAMAITDHDTVAGIEEARMAAADCDAILISGIEISVAGNDQLHILGYGIDERSEIIQKYVQQATKWREERNQAIADCLREQGVAVSLDDIIFYNGRVPKGKPEFARVLVDMKYAASVKEAFVNYLDTPIMKERAIRPKISAEEAIHIIREAGGFAVMAHPLLLNMELPELTDLVEELVSYGLRGIEVFHSSHSKKDSRQYMDLVRKYHLMYTCGSDYHGELVKPDVYLGLCVKNSATPLPREIENNILNRVLTILNKKRMQRYKKQ